MTLRSLIVNLVAVSCLLCGAASSEPAPLHIEGEVNPALTRPDDAMSAAYRHEGITHITFHHEGFAGADAALFRRASAARDKQTIRQRLRNIDHYHAGQAGLGMFAYHYAVDKHGQIAKGRPVRLKPATMSTIKGSSRRADFAGHFAVVALGDFNHEHLTEAARLSLVRVMSEAQRAYRVPTERIRPHLDHADTSCPGTHLAARADDLRQEVLNYGLQDELARRGCGPLTADGIWGPASDRAFARIRAQNAEDLVADSAGETALFQMMRNPALKCH